MLVFRQSIEVPFQYLFIWKIFSKKLGKTTSNKNQFFRKDIPIEISHENKYFAS